jgi:hypothetical protein
MPILRWFQAFQKQEPNGTINAKPLAAYRSERKLRSLRRSTRFAAVGFRRQTGSRRAPCQQKNTARIANIITLSLRGEGLSCRSCLSKSSWSRWSIVLELSLFQQGSVSSKRSRRGVCLLVPFQKNKNCAVPEKLKLGVLELSYPGSFIIQNDKEGAQCDTNPKALPRSK